MLRISIVKAFIAIGLFFSIVLSYAVGQCSVGPATKQIGTVGACTNSSGFGNPPSPCTYSWTISAAVTYVTESFTWTGGTEVGNGFGPGMFYAPVQQGCGPAGACSNAGQISPAHPPTISKGIVSEDSDSAVVWFLVANFVYTGTYSTKPCSNPTGDPDYAPDGSPSVAPTPGAPPPPGTSFTNDTTAGNGMSEEDDYYLFTIWCS
jgi:hypothetical protein